MNSFSSTSIRCLLVLLISALLVSGCSSSSDSKSGDSQTAADVSGTNGDGIIPSDGTGGNTDESEAVTAGDTTSGTETESTDGTDESTSGSGDDPISDLELPESGNPVVVDPLIQNRILVRFDISVPAYQSNELSLEVVWGDLNLIAGWVGDEFWTVSGEFPTETEELLTVTFFDNNGAIELASFSQPFRTGSNATEAFQISADQFGVDQFDDDRDGVSNFDELIAGTNPTIDEDSLLEIRDTIAVSTFGLAVKGLESLLTEERPISTTTQELINSAVTIDTDIQIDMDGNGTVTENRTFRCEFDRTSGIRTNVGNAISWEADRVQTDCDFTLRAELTNTITIVDENTRTFFEDGFSTRTGSFTNSWETDTSLVGQLVEGTSLCEPVSGTYSQTFRTNSNGNRIIVTLASKELDEPYWRVTTERSEAIFAVNGASILGFEIAETSEYFARELSFGGGSENSGLFICDFVDI